MQKTNQKKYLHPFNTEPCVMSRILILYRDAGNERCIKKSVFMHIRTSFSTLDHKSYLHLKSAQWCQCLYWTPRRWCQCWQDARHGPVLLTPANHLTVWFKWSENLFEVNILLGKLYLTWKRADVMNRWSCKYKHSVRPPGTDQYSICLFWRRTAESKLNIWYL